MLPPNSTRREHHRYGDEGPKYENLFLEVWALGHPDEMYVLLPKVETRYRASPLLLNTMKPENLTSRVVDHFGADTGGILERGIMHDVSRQVLAP